MGHQISALEIVQKFIHRKKLFTPSDILLVGVSGGADSVVLLHMLVKSGYKCIVAHMNFNLRGADSDGDEEFVRQLAETHNCTFECKSVDTIGFSETTGQSIEMAARELRYNWFRELMTKHSISSIVVGHHKNDSIETFFLNLLRSSGLRGLGGIAAKRNGVVRPLLAIDKSDILKYASNWRLNYRTDSTNSDIIYKRNNIRKNVIPLFESIEPSFAKVMSRNLSYLQDATELVDDFILDWKYKNLLVDNGIYYIPYSSVINKGYGRLLLFEALKEYGFKNDSIADIYDASSQESGREFYSSTHRVVSDRGRWIITNIDISFQPIAVSNDTLPGHNIIVAGRSVTFELIDRVSLSAINAGKQIAYLDFDMLIFPLQLRGWKVGDWFIPLGMRGKKKISDFMIDKKFSLVEKERVIILKSNDEVVWLMGHRMDDRFKVTDKTNRILKVQID